MALINQTLDKFVQLKLEKEKLASNSAVFVETIKLVDKELEELKTVIIGEKSPSSLSYKQYKSECDCTILRPCKIHR